MAADADYSFLQRLLEGEGGARVKVPSAATRTRVRASGVPVALLDNLDQVAAALGPSLNVVTRRVLRTTYDALVVDLTLEGPALPGNLWKLDGLGCQPVVVRRIDFRRSGSKASPLSPVARVPSP